MDFSLLYLNVLSFAFCLMDVFNYLVSDVFFIIFCSGAMNCGSHFRERFSDAIHLCDMRKLRVILNIFFQFVTHI